MRSSSRFARETVISGALVVVVGIVVVIEGLRLSEFRGAKSIGDDTFPLILGAAFVLLGALQILGVGGTATPPTWASRRILTIMGLSLSALVVYGFAIPILGYSLSTGLSSAVLFNLVGRYRWYACLAMGALLALILRQAFVVWLTIPFPNGILGF